jgi:hypothetical protein
MTRSLVLRREALPPLTTEELEAFAAAAQQPTGGPSCPALLCKTSVHPHCPSGFTCPTE